MITCTFTCDNCQWAFRRVTDQPQPQEMPCSHCEGGVMHRQFVVNDTDVIDDVQRVTKMAPPALVVAAKILAIIALLMPFVIGLLIGLAL